MCVKRVFCCERFVKATIFFITIQKKLNMISVRPF